MPLVGRAKGKIGQSNECAFYLSNSRLAPKHNTHIQPPSEQARGIVRVQEPIPDRWKYSRKVPGGLVTNLPQPPSISQHLVSRKFS